MKKVKKVMKKTFDVAAFQKRMQELYKDIDQTEDDKKILRDEATSIRSKAQWANKSPAEIAKFAAKISAANTGKPSPNKGKTTSEEFKAKISAARKGQPSPNKGKPSPNKGKPRSEETKAKIKAVKKGRREETKARRSAANKANLLKKPEYIFVAKHIKKSKEDIVQLFMKEFKLERRKANTKVRGLIKKYHEINPESMT